MNRFKKTIATAVSIMVTVMTLIVLHAVEAMAKSKTPFDQSYLPPATTAKIHPSAKISAPKSGIGKTANSINMDNGFNGIGTPIGFHLLPHIEQN